MKVLIVDDVAENLQLLSRILHAEGHSVLTAENGRQGVRLANAEFPELILMDIEMPVMNGEDAMKILKADPATANIQIVACTGLALGGDKEMFLRNGFDGVIGKPVRLEELLGMIEMVVGRQQGGRR